MKTKDKKKGNEAIYTVTSILATKILATKIQERDLIPKTIEGLLEDNTLRQIKRRYSKVSKYEATKQLLNRLDSLKNMSRLEVDKNVMKTYGEAYLAFCSHCEFLNFSDPLYCKEKCDIHSIKRKSFRYISNSKLLRDFIDELAERS